MEGGDGILQSIGSEITGIVMPVSLCMLLVVMLVRCLTPHGTDVSVRSMATLLYTEKESDSTSQKLEGALLNSIAFVLVVTVVTFLLVLLYYYRCTKCIKYYICFSAALMLSNMGGVVMLQLIQTLSIPIDMFSFAVLILNFTAVGALAVFLSSSMPILVTQFYLVMIGMLAAFWFTMLPEWTTWMILVAMAVYDVVAVLAPKGPLNILVELAISRDEELPALIYETRPAINSDYRVILPSDDLESTGIDASGQNQGRPRRWRVHDNRSMPTRERSMEMQPRDGADTRPTSIQDSVRSERSIGMAHVEDNSETTESPSGRLLSHRNAESNGELLPLVRHEPPHRNAGGNEESLPLVRHESPPAMQVVSRSGASDNQGDDQGFQVSDAENMISNRSGGLKLGLGDFVFYSLLVGRAAMYDLTTVYACYFAIIAGLGTTLILLAVARRALPALPISIALGVVFYFLTRLLMEPFVAGLSTSLVYF